MQQKLKRVRYYLIKSNKYIIKEMIKLDDKIEGDEVKKDLRRIKELNYDVFGRAEMPSWASSSLGNDYPSRLHTLMNYSLTKVVR